MASGIPVFMKIALKISLNKTTLGDRVKIDDDCPFHGQYTVFKDKQRP
ncbi:MAG: hypothetical protein H6Q49_503 [Deltaproteobacteria bacterium]|nr:hypothetical protein [Deltaproteobacteria bacterium]